MESIRCEKWRHGGRRIAFLEIARRPNVDFELGWGWSVLVDLSPVSGADPRRVHHGCNRSVLLDAAWRLLDDKVGTRTTSQVVGLPTMNFGALTEAQVGALTPTLPAALAGADMAEFYGTQLASLSGTQLRALSTTAVGALVETQVAALTTTQLCEIDALTDDESFCRARLARRHYHHPMDADGRLWAGEEKPDAQRARAKPKAA